MEQAIRAELWEVLDTSDLDNVTSKEVAGCGDEGELGPGWGPEAGCQSGPSWSLPLALLLSELFPHAWPQLLAVMGRVLTCRGPRGEGGAKEPQGTPASPHWPVCRSARPWSCVWDALSSSTATSSTTRCCCSWPSKTGWPSASPHPTW